MQEATAIKTALGLLHLPSNLKRVRAESLPRDVDVLIRIAAGDEQAELDAAAATDRPRHMIHEAAVFYVEQVLLSPQSDCYRMLGGTHETGSQDLRRNMALLLTWLHPDKNPDGERAAMAARVAAAWSELRSPERRASYDAQIETTQKKPRGEAGSLVKLRRTTGKRPSGSDSGSGWPSHHRTAGRVHGSPGLFGRSLRFLRRVLIPSSGP